MRILALLVCALLMFQFSAVAQTIGEKMPDQKGLTLEVQGRGMINMRLVDRRLQLVFMDLDGRVEQCPFSRVVVHIEHRGKNGDEMHLVLRPEAGKAALRHNRYIPPPNTYRVRIVLFPHEDSKEGMLVIPLQTFTWVE